MSKIVIAHYSSESIFKIPKGLDLDDETQVKGWGVKWDRLFIELADGTDLTIESYGDGGVDYKWPNDTEIGLAEDYIHVSDDEEEDVVTDDTIVTGIVCKSCDNVLPPRTASEHLDVENKIHECPHVDKEAEEAVSELTSVQKEYNTNFMAFQRMEEKIRNLC